jgi:hypothetical protein
MGFSLTEEDRRFMIEAPPEANWEFRIAKGNELGHFELEQLNSTIVKCFRDFLLKLYIIFLKAQLAMAREIPIGSMTKGTEELVIEAVNQDDPSESLLTNVKVKFDSDGTNRSIPHKIRPPADSEGKMITVVLDNQQDGQKTRNASSPIFSVAEEQSKKARYMLAENPDGLFRLDPDTGELFLVKSVSASNSRNVSSLDFELLVNVVDHPSGKVISQKIYTVRLVPAKLEASRLHTPDGEEKSITRQPAMEPLRLAGDGNVRLSLDRYHFVVENPEKDALVGQLTILNQQAPPTHSLTVEPSQLRTWFRIDPRVIFD